MRRYLAIAAAAAAIVMTVSRGAFGAMGYEDPSVLTIESGPGAAIATYTYEDLKQSFPLHERVTATPWTDGEPVRFRGPYLKDVLAKHGLAKSDSIEVFAFDEFLTQVRKQEIDDYEPILAIERACTETERPPVRCAEGQDFIPLPMREAGPFFIVWPIEDLPESYVPARNSIWVWFVVALRPAP